MKSTALLQSLPRCVFIGASKRARLQELEKECTGIGSSHKQEVSEHLVCWWTFPCFQTSPSGIGVNGKAAILVLKLERLLRRMAEQARLGRPQACPARFPIQVERKYFGCMFA